MKISVLVRTRDEERNIQKFCQSYDWADHILVADGGSIDQTRELAMKFPNVKVRDFTEIISIDAGKTWRNPHGRHINFMIKWAEEMESDWVIFDDADCFPNEYLQNDCRVLLESTKYLVACVNRIYTYESDYYFKELTIPHGAFENSTSLYAWRTNMGFYANESNPWEHGFTHNIPERHLDILPPYCVLHDYYPIDGSRQEKVKYYDKSGEQPGCQDPMKAEPTILPMEPWMKE